jgi:Protein of unknown function (DUF3551)
MSKYEETLMRTLAIIAIACTAVALSTGGVQAAPWCAQYGSKGSPGSCGFYSFQQCMAALSGNGGFCNRNPFENQAVPQSKEPTPR